MYDCLRIIYFLLCALVFLPLQGQDQLQDSLTTLLNQNISDSLRIHIYNELAWIYKSDQPEQAFEHANQALALAKKTNNPFGLANATHGIGMINWYQGDYEKASEFFIRSFRYERKATR